MAVLDAAPRAPGRLDFALSAALFACVLGSYYVLRPLRDAFGVSQGVANLKWLYTGTFTAMLLASPCFSALSGRVDPRRLVPWVFHFFAANLAVFAVLLFALEGAARQTAADAFFVWVSVYNLFVVSVFWSFMADRFTNEEGERSFGPIAAGGTLGGIAGTAVTLRAVHAVDPAFLLLASAALLELAVALAARLRRRAPARAQTAARREPGLGLLAGARLVLRSRYLLAICAFLLLTTACASVASYQRSAIVAAASDELVERVRSFARMDLVTNAAILGLQALVARPLLRRIGAGATLAILPLAYAVGFGALALAPTLWTITAFEAGRRAIGYGLATPTTQVLYTLVSPREKYAAKNFVETAVWRGGDLVGVHLADLVALAGTRLALLGACALPATAAWLGVARWIGRLRGRRLAGGGS